MIGKTVKFIYSKHRLEGEIIDIINQQGGVEIIVINVNGTNYEISRANICSIK